MELILTEEQRNEQFKNACKLYKEIIENIFTKTLQQANNKAFAKNYFIQQLESELDFHQGFPFNATVLSYFELFYNLGFLWDKFFKEIRILQNIYSYNESKMNTNDYAKIYAEFTPQEVKRIVWESKMLQGNNAEKTIYDFVHCVLLTKKRTIDFVKYIAKYKSVYYFVQTIRIENESNEVNNKNFISTSNNSIRWNRAKGKKIELIRLLVALNDNKYFETREGLIPSQEQLMNYFGEILSINLNYYEQDLSNGFESKLQTNGSIFDKLKSAIEKRFYQKVEQN
jgi:hypothetical protein